jgi:5'-3' exonuclease
LIILVDTRYVLYRSHYTTGMLALEDGTPTGAMFGLCRTLRSFHEAYNKGGEIVKFLLCHDGGIPEFRKAMIEYKAGRTIDEDVRRKVNAQEKVVQESLPLAQWILPGFEADDLIASFCTSFGSDEQIAIITNDQDIWACLRDHIWIQKSISDPVVNIEYMGKEYYGITPDLWPLCRAIGGDQSDNIKGIPGFKAKRASNWIMGGAVVELLQDPTNRQIVERNMTINRLVTELKDWPEPTPIEMESWNNFVLTYDMVNCLLGHSMALLGDRLNETDDLESYKYPEEWK